MRYASESTLNSVCFNNKHSISTFHERTPSSILFSGRDALGESIGCSSFILKADRTRTHSLEAATATDQQ